MGSVSSGREPRATSETSRARTSGVFVGRESELEELEAGLEDALSGRGRLFLLGGEPGIGKSRLADELGREASRRGAKVLWGRSWEAGGAPAYWPWVQSLRSYFRDCDPPTLGRQLGGGASDLVQLFPELREILTDLPEPSDLTDPEGARFRLFDSICTFLKNASGDQPLVLVLDDLHAADTPSLLLLRFLADELGKTHVLIVGSYRDDELGPDHPLGSALVELGRQPATRHLRLSGLRQVDLAAFIELTTARAPSEKVVAAVHQETEGNPLFVGEVIRLLASQGRLDHTDDAVSFTFSIPAGVREVIGRRLHRLSEGCHRVLTLASVIGRYFEIGVLESMSELARGELLEVLGEATAARVVTDAPGSISQLRFAHALIRDTLYEELASPERVRLHRRAGEVLEAFYAQDPEPHLAELAYHFFEAAKDGEADKAVDYGRRAGDRAVSLLAYEEAVRLYRLALDALEGQRSVYDAARCELLLALGDAQARAGDQIAAKERFLEAAKLAKDLELPDHLARAAIGYGGRFVWARSGDDPSLVAILQDALAGLGDEDSPLRARLLARLAGAVRDRPGRELAATISLQAVEMARRIDDPATLAYALDGRYAAVWWPENPDERLAIATELLEVAREARDAERIAEAHDYRICALMELGDIAAADAELEASERAVEQLRQPAQRWILLHTRAMRALFDGRFEEAEELIPEALKLGERAQRWDAVMTFRLQTSLVLIEQGRLQETEALVRRSVAEYPTRPIFRCLLAFVYAELGRRTEALSTFEAVAVHDFGDLIRDNMWILGLSFLPEVTRFLGDLRRAARLYEVLLPFAQGVPMWGAEISTGSASRCLGILASTMSRWDESARHFEDALDVNSRMGARPWVAHTQHEYARMLVARDLPGDRQRAEKLLGDASATCRELGMVALGERVSALRERTRGAIGASAEATPPASSDAASIRPAVFHREGEYWSIAYEGDVFRLKDSKGLRYLARLLKDSGVEVHVMDLASNLEGSGGAPYARERSRRHEHVHLGSDDAGSILDPQAKAEYRSRLSELEEELAEAEAWDDAERAARVKEERDFLVRELAGAVGLGGRDRKAASVSEQTRVNVTKAIRSALARIRRESPALGQHLDRTIRTGTFCSYVPDPRVPVPWQL